MLNLNLYIRSAAAIAPEAPAEEVLQLSAQEPDYMGMIAPMQLRRMSKAVRMGIGAAKATMLSAGLEKPDAIAVGTAIGCIADTEVFLKKMVVQEEQMLTPTAFIQSTHNTVAGQIALAMGCHGYNNTIVQHGHSFEGALISAALYLAEHPEHNVLCGGVDELTDTVLGLMQRIGVYTSKPYQSTEEHAVYRGAIAGEGSGFLLLGLQKEQAGARIAGLELFNELVPATAAARILDCISRYGGLRNTDLLLTGATGDLHYADAYLTPLNHGKHYRQSIGAWGTDVSVAIAQLVESWPAEKERAWIVTHWGSDWSIYLLERA
jgi:3-oxoacyl-[acyl-carrier-protein] synthase II